MPKARFAPEAPTPIPPSVGVSLSLNIKFRERGMMARTLESTPQLRAVMALAEARKARHHKDCFCRQFQKIACNAADALWTQKLNRELDELPRDP